MCVNPVTIAVPAFHRQAEEGTQPRAENAGTGCRDSACGAGNGMSSVVK